MSSWIEKERYTINPDGSWEYPEEFEDAQRKGYIKRVGFLDNHFWDRESNHEWYEDGTLRM